MAQDVAAPAHSIDSILDQLDRFHQRVTYGAVAKLVGRAPRNLMSGRERDARSSWIVSRDSGLPTGYKPEQMHSELTTREEILDTAEELEVWLANPA